MLKNILITGVPKSGKSTVLKRVIEKISDKTGFLTSEIKENNIRTGFEIEASNDKKEILASVNFKTNIKVSKYCVKPENLDIIIPEISKFDEKDILYIDEIGQMELYSEKFKELVNKYLNSENTCICTLSKVFKSDFIDKIKRRTDLILIEINPENREYQLKFINALIGKIEKARNYIKEPERFKFEKGKVILNSTHGIRKINKENNKFICDCPFFKEHNICSHVIAAKELSKPF